MRCFLLAVLASLMFSATANASEYLPMKEGKRHIRSWVRDLADRMYEGSYNYTATKGYILGDCVKPSPNKVRCATRVRLFTVTDHIIDCDTKMTAVNTNAGFIDVRYGRSDCN